MASGVPIVLFQWWIFRQCYYDTAIKEAYDILKVICGGDAYLTTKEIKFTKYNKVSLLFILE